MTEHNKGQETIQRVQKQRIAAETGGRADETWKDLPDERLIEMLRSGRPEITDYLMEKYKPLVRKEANMMFLIGGETEDLIQEGMIGLFKAVRDYDPQQASRFYTFAGICIRRQMYSAVKASNRKKNQPLNSYVSISGENGGLQEALPTDMSTNPEEQVIGRENMRLLTEQINRNLSRMERAVLQLYLDGKNYIQIAQILNKSPKSIDNALQRIRRKIRLLTDGIHGKSERG